MCLCNVADPVFAHLYFNDDVINKATCFLSIQLHRCVKDTQIRQSYQRVEGGGVEGGISSPCPKQYPLPQRVLSKRKRTFIRSMERAWTSFMHSRSCLGTQNEVVTTQTGWSFRRICIVNFLSCIALWSYWSGCKGDSCFGAWGEGGICFIWRF